MASEATIVIFDVGGNTKEYDKATDQTFFDQAKSCIEAFLTRKIFIKPKDSIALCLMGTPNTDNNLNDVLGGYNNINLVLEMTPIDWDAIKLQMDIKPSENDITADWMEATLVALDYFHNLKLEKCKKRIILFTTFSTPVGGDIADAIAGSLEENDIELVVITKNVEVNKNGDSNLTTFSQTMVKDATRKKSEFYITQILSETNGKLYNFDEALSQFVLTENKPRRRVPWNCALTFGTKLSINVSAYIYVRKETELKTWKRRHINNNMEIDSVEIDGTQSGPSTSGPSQPLVSKYKLHQDGKNIEEDMENIVKGYLYNGVAVPFEDYNFGNSGKGFRTLGITDVSMIKDHYLAGDSTWLVVAQKGYDVSAKRLNALRKVMQSENYALLARYTYSNTSAPKLMALFANEKTLYMHEVSYKENHLNVTFASLGSKTNKPTDNQLNVIDKLFESIDFDGRSKSNAEYFKTLHDIGTQNVYRCLAHRATNPNDAMPEVGKELIHLIMPPKPIDHSLNTDMKELLPLVRPKKTLKEIREEEMIEKANSGDEPPAGFSIDRKITEIGNNEPAKDFLYLLSIGDNFNVLAQQIQNVVVELTNTHLKMDNTIIEAVVAYRDTAKQKAPFKYNEWIATFKHYLKIRKKTHLWELIANKKLGLISKVEGELSTVTIEEAAAFYKRDFELEPITCEQMNLGADINNENEDLYDVID